METENTHFVVELNSPPRFVLTVVIEWNKQWLGYGLEKRIGKEAEQVF